MVDISDLGSEAERRTGSNPVIPTFARELLEQLLLPFWATVN